MYGMVMNALEEMATRRLGKTGWQLICKTAQVEDELFLSMTPYPDEVTFALAGATAGAFELSLPEFLEEFGRYWVEYALETAYGPLLRSGKSLIETLEGLDRMHSQIGRTLPKLRPPSFKVTAEEDGAYIRYFSERQGLAPFVVGLLYGLAKMHGQGVSVRQISEKSRSQKYDEFRIDFLTEGQGV